METTTTTKTTKGERWQEEVVDRWGLGLEELGKRSRGLTKRGVIERLMPKIEMLQEKHIPLAEIAEYLAEQGFPITGVQIRGYLGQLKRSKGKGTKRVRTRSPGAEPRQGRARAPSEQSLPSVGTVEPADNGKRETAPAPIGSANESLNVAAIRVETGGNGKRETAPLQIGSANESPNSVDVRVETGSKGAPAQMGHDSTAQTARGAEVEADEADDRGRSGSGDSASPEIDRDREREISRAEEEDADEDDSEGDDADTDEYGEDDEPESDDADTDEYDEDDEPESEDPVEGGSSSDGNVLVPADEIAFDPEKGYEMDWSEIDTRVRARYADEIDPNADLEEMQWPPREESEAGQEESPASSKGRSPP